MQSRRHGALQKSRHGLPQPLRQMGPGGPGLYVTRGKTTGTTSDEEEEVVIVVGVALKLYGYGGGVMVRMTSGCDTPGDDLGLRSLVTTNGGGRTMGVTAKDDTTPEPLCVQHLYYHTSMAVVTTGGMVSVVVCTVLVQPVGSDHATSSDVV